MRARLTLALLCALTLGGCTYAVVGGHHADSVPRYYQDWHDEAWRHHTWAVPEDGHPPR